jgi:hypothetical protein
MTRFNRPDEVVEWADSVAAKDYERHITKGHDLNPYCTEGARNVWRRGFEGAPCPYSYAPIITGEFDTMFQRGRAVARIVKAKEGVQA